MEAERALAKRSRSEVEPQLALVGGPAPRLTPSPSPAVVRTRLSRPSVCVSPLPE